MPRPRFQNADPAKQEAILQAAAKEFAQSGYEGASINRILTRAGMSKGAFYYYFDDKADLAAETLRWAYQDVLKIYDRMHAPEDPARFWEAMEAFAREGVAMMERSPYANELASRLGLALAQDKELSARVTDTFADAMRVFVGFLRDGQAVGAIRDDLPAEVLAGLMQAVKETILRAYLPGVDQPTREDFERLSALQLDLYRRLAAPVQEDSP